MISTSQTTEYFTWQMSDSEQCIFHKFLFKQKETFPFSTAYPDQHFKFILI